MEVKTEGGHDGNDGDADHDANSDKDGKGQEADDGDVKMRR